MISVKGVSKFFGQVPAVKDVSFEIPRGQLVGFLGPNGAGKTTLMRLLTSYFLPTRGQVLIDGLDAVKSSLLVRRKIGYLPETPPLYANMSVYDYLKFTAALKDIPSNKQRSQIEKVLSECDLLDAREKIIGTLSKGYKQRVGIAQAIINDPEILILDEPTSGLDPLQIQQVRRLIKSLEQKRTVILSTHILSEIEQVVERVIILKEGQIVADDSIHHLLAAHEAEHLEEVFLKIVS